MYIYFRLYLDLRSIIKLKYSRFVHSMKYYFISYHVFIIVWGAITKYESSF